MCHWLLRKSVFLIFTVNVCCFRCPWEENVVLNPHCLGFAPCNRSMSPSWDWDTSFQNIPQLASLMNGWKQLQCEEIWGVQEGNRDISASRLERLWGTIWQFLPYFASFCLYKWCYQDLLDCARCFQSPLSALVSIIIAFFHVGRNYGRSQWISVSFFSQISVISSNPVDKAKPKLPFNLQSTYQPLWLCLDHVLQRILKNWSLHPMAWFLPQGYFIIGQVEWGGEISKFL